MSAYLEIIVKIIPVIVLFMLGALLRKIRFFKEGSIADLKSLVVNISLPCLLFLAFASAKLQLSYLLIIGAVFGICLFMLAIGKPLGRLAGVQSPYFAFLLAGFETGMLGYAIYTSVFGIEHISKLALIDLGQVLFVFFVLMTILLKMKGEAGSPKEVAKLFISSPVIISIFTGIAVGLIARAVPIFGNEVWGTVEGLARMIGSITTPVICIVIGYELQFSGGGIWKSVKTILIRTAFLLVLALLVNRFLIRGLLNLDIMYEYAVLTMFLLPPPFVISVFMDSGDTKNTHYVAATLSLSTVVSLGVFIIVMMVMQSL
jgi:malate permease and related proteins